MATAKSYFAEKLKFEIDPWGVEKLLDGKENTYLVLDVRNREAYDEGHIPKAKNIPIDKLAYGSRKLPKDKMIIVYCYNVACFRATRAALELAKNGFKVMEMAGGFDEWRKHGYKIEKIHKQKKD